MKHYLALGGIVLVVLVLAFFFFSRETAEAPTAQDPSLPLITVTSGEVFLEKDGTERMVERSESVAIPFTLRSGTEGTATVRFPDASELRLDRNSNVAVTAASYDTDTKQLNVHTKLSVGRVWSAIVSLATPESSWEVETSNVVATVRGTAFSVEARENGDTMVVVSENDVELTLIHPDTGERDAVPFRSLGGGESILITDDSVRDAFRGGALPLPEPADLLSDSWYTVNKALDEAVWESLPEIEVDTDMRIEIRTGPDDGATDPNIVPVGAAVPAAAPTQPLPIPAAVTPVSLSINPAPPTTMVEGATFTFTATLTYSDGTKKDVTRSVAWSVTGGIGTVQYGLFTALLDATVSEHGKSRGTVVARWTEPGTRTQLTASTNIFEVTARIVPIAPRG